VLDDFALDEAIVMQGAYERAAQAVEVFVTQGIEAAMNQFNPPDSQAKSDGRSDEKGT